jgi:hypothetical protein
MVVEKWRCSIYRYALVALITWGAIVYGMSSCVYAGGVHFGFGVDVPLPGYAAPPPVVFERPPVVIERVAPPVVVERRAPVVVYEEPVVVEQRTSVYYYRPARQQRPYYDETEREYYRYRKSTSRDDYVEY